MASPQLAIVHIAAAQNQKEATANAGFDALDNADNAEVSFANSNTDMTLSQAQLASGGSIVITGALTADRHVNLPAVARSFIFKNGTTGGHNLIVQVTGAPGTTASVPASAGLVELYSDGTNVAALTGGSGSAGTVTSVALTMPAEFSVAGSPIATAGTLAVTRVSQSANKVLASPDGSSGVMSPRALAPLDLPSPTEINLAPGADGNFQVAHGLSGTPRLALIQMTSGGAIWFQSTRYDATNIYLVASDASVTGKAEVWL
jgi:hypothetical protein